MTDIVDELRARALQGRFNLEAADEIERLRAELSEQCRLLGMGASREAALLAKLEAAEKERDTLRARIEAMERQEPVGRALLCVRCSTPFDGEHYCPACGHHTATEGAVYALPGAQPAPSAQDDVMRGHVMDAVAKALGDAYDCTRVWSAWGYGTMGSDDFRLVANDPHRLHEIAEAAIQAVFAAALKPEEAK